MAFEFRLPSLAEMNATIEGQIMLNYSNKDDFGAMLLTGCAGSGKTTIAAYRLLRLANQNKNVKLFTFHKMLAYSIEMMLRNLGVSNANTYAATFKKWAYDETNSSLTSDVDLLEKLALKLALSPNVVEYIFDEAQDLPVCVYEKLPQYCDRFFLSCDDAQRVHDEGATVREIATVIKWKKRFDEHLLDRNFRNTYETYRFAIQFQPDENEAVRDPNLLQQLEKNDEKRGDKPVVIEYWDVKQRDADLKMRLQNAVARGGSIAVLCPIGLKKRERYEGESVEGMHLVLLQMGFNCSVYHNETNVPTDLKDILITTFKSSKGLEFDEVYIPRYNFFKRIDNEWYVACTRARRQLVIYRDLEHANVDPIKGFNADTYQLLTQVNRASCN